MKNDVAGASAIGSLLAILFTGAVDIVLWYALDKSHFMFAMIQSADAANTITFLMIGMLDVPILVLVAVIFNHWITEKSMANQGA